MKRRIKATSSNIDILNRILVNLHDEVNKLDNDPEIESIINNMIDVAKADYIRLKQEYDEKAFKEVR